MSDKKEETKEASPAKRGPRFSLRVNANAFQNDLAQVMEREKSEIIKLDHPDIKESSCNSVSKQLEMLESKKKSSSRKKERQVD